MGTVFRDSATGPLRFKPAGSCNFELVPGELHLWRTSLRVTPAERERLVRSLSADERLRASRFHFSEDKDAFIAARGTLRALLGAYLKISAAALRFRYGPNGKPELPGHPIQFNLSHSGAMTIFAFSRYGNIGVDIEANDRQAPLEVAETYFSKAESAHLRGLDASEQTAGFFQCWTCKEALLKAWGIGLSAPLDQFDVSFGPHEPVRLLKCPKEFGSVSRWHLENIDFSHGYTAALAIEGACPVLRGFIFERESLLL